MQFTSLAENADSIVWYFPGGIPGSSNELNPVVTYNDPGLYDIVLAAFNAFGDATTFELN